MEKLEEDDVVPAFLGRSPQTIVAWAVFKKCTFLNRKDNVLLILLYASSGWKVEWYEGTILQLKSDRRDLERGQSSRPNAAVRVWCVNRSGLVGHLGAEISERLEEF
jgi:hypothetical protein